MSTKNVGEQLKRATGRQYAVCPECGNSMLAAVRKVHSPHTIFDTFRFRGQCPKCLKIFLGLVQHG